MAYKQDLLQSTARLLMIIACVHRKDLRDAASANGANHSNPGLWSDLPAIYQSIDSKGFNDICKSFRDDTDKVRTHAANLQTASTTPLGWNPAGAKCAPDTLLDAMMRGVKDYLEL